MPQPVLPDQSPVDAELIARLEAKHAELLAELATLKDRYQHVEHDVNEYIDKANLKSILEKIHTL